MKAFHQLLLIILGVTALRAAEPEKQKPLELTTLLGETYHNARIIKATPDALTVVHDAGVSKVPFESLSDEWKQKYNYSPDKAREFQKQEEARRQLAEEAHKKAQKEYEEQTTKQMAELALHEKRRAEFDDMMARQQAESAPKTTTIVSGHEIVVPQNSPITQIYTPGYTRGQGLQSTTIYEGTIFTPGDGSLYYFNPGCYDPYHYTPVRPVPYCPTPNGNLHPHGTTFQFGNGSFQISR